MFRAPDPLLRLQGVHVALAGRPILHDVGFAAGEGTWVGLLGPNGSGKTTLLRTLSGALPYTGDITFAGRPLRAWRPAALARHLAFVRQSTPLVFDFTVEDLVLLGRSPHKRWLAPYTQEDRDLLDRALGTFELQGFARRSVLTLSGGEVQRVLLAQAFVQQATLLLLDEPTAHLDVRHQFEFLDRVQALVATGRTVIAVFHDLEQAARYAHQVLVLDGGRLVAAGPPAEVLSEALIASVFRMRAECVRGADGTLRIHYRAPLAPAR